MSITIQPKQKLVHQMYVPKKKILRVRTIEAIVSDINRQMYKEK